jgi:DNA (cytosine-5)-methyltransferase 1
VNELALFAGAGGGILGGHLLGWRTVCAVEIAPFAAGILCARQNDGLLSVFPVWDDVCTFDGRPWRGRVDVISGGFPCQDISNAGKGAGITGERSGLWTQFARIIREVEPAFAFVENSLMLASRGLDVVLADLAEMGFDAEWCVLGADAVGAQHHRERIWILASHPGRQHGVCPPTPGRCDSPNDLWQHGEFNDAVAACPAWPRGQPAAGVMADGLAPWVDEFRAIGNGQVPAVAARAWNLLSARFSEPMK